MNVPIDITGVCLTTERLILRPWRLSDLNDFYEYASVDGVGQMAGWKPHGSINESEAILKSFIDGKKTFAVEREGKVIGSVGIEKYDEKRFPEFDGKRCREIGYVLAKNYWGQGLMPEAAGEIIRWLFEDIGLDAVFCGHFLRNTQSARVQEKCGFRRYGYGQHTTVMGTVEESAYNILFRGDWRHGR